MAGDIFDLIDPVELTEVARLALADEDRPQNALILERWFPNVSTSQIEWETTGHSTRTFTDAMPFRSFTTGAPIGTRPGRVQKRGELPPLSKGLIMTERELIKMREASAQGGDAADAVRGDVYDDITTLIRAARVRMEAVRADLLMTGSASISENGLSLTVDFGRDAGRASTVSVAWSTAASATPIDDEVALLQTMEDDEGLSPSDLVAIMNRTTFNYWKATDQVRGSANTVRVLDTLGVGDLNQIRANLELPEVIVYNASVNNSAGSSRKVISNNKVVYVPRSAVIGNTQWGVPAIADQPEIRLERDERPGPVAYLTRQVNPLIIETVVDAIGFPVFADTDATYCLTTA